MTSPLIVHYIEYHRGVSLPNAGVRNVLYIVNFKGLYFIFSVIRVFTVLSHNTFILLFHCSSLFIHVGSLIGL